LIQTEKAVEEISHQQERTRELGYEEVVCPEDVYVDLAEGEDGGFEESSIKRM